MDSWWRVERTVGGELNGQLVERQRWRENPRYAVKTPGIAVWWRVEQSCGELRNARPTSCRGSA